jgi:hypothetical protein
MSESFESRDFDWLEADEHVAVPEQQALAVYTNPRGDVVVRQRGDYPDEDVWIIVNPANAAALAAAILEAAGYSEPAPVTSQHRHSQPKDKTAADRQRRYRERNRHGPHRDVTDSDGEVTP